MVKTNYLHDTSHFNMKCQSFFSLCFNQYFLVSHKITISQVGRYFMS